MVVIWDNVGYYGYGVDKLNTFEIIMTNGTDPLIGLGNNVCFSYADMQWTTGSASGGSGGFGGTPATVGINKGDGETSIQSGRFDQPGTLYDGGDGNNDGVDWLDDRDLYLQVGGGATLIITLSEPDIVTDGIGMPGGLSVDDPDVDAFYATYPEEDVLIVPIPVEEGFWYGYIYYGTPGAWHQADVFPVEGPGTVVFSNVPFTGAKEDIPVILNYEEEETLPVELSAFTATITSQNYVNLNWTTQSETGALGFYVWRSDSLDLNSAEIVSPMVYATNTSVEQHYSYLDMEVEPSMYYYWLQNVELNGVSGYHGPIIVTVTTPEDTPPVVIPEITGLKSIFPNPFNPSTTITFGITIGDKVIIEIYNLRGERVRNLVSTDMVPGVHHRNWDGKDDNGRDMSSGIYFVRMTAGKYSSNQKVILMK